MADLLKEEVSVRVLPVPSATTMPFTRQLEVYVHPLHPPLTPRQLERRALFSHHFGSTLPFSFTPKAGKPPRNPPPLPFWFPSPDRVISTSDTPSFPVSFPSPATTAGSPGTPSKKSPSSDLKSSASPSVSTSSPYSSSACAWTDYSSLRLLPGYSYADGLTYSCPPGQRLRLHYLSAAEGATKCRTQVRSDGLRFNASGSRLLVAAREHVLVLNADVIATESCITCPGAAIVLPHNTHPDLVAVAGQEAYQQSPYVRLYDVRTPPSNSSSSTTRSSSSVGSGGREDTTPVVELWGARQDGWWSACWSPVGEKIVCVDRKDVLHVFSLNEGMRKSSARAVAASGSRISGRAGAASFSGTSTAATAAAAGKSSTSSSSTSKRTGVAAEAGSGSAVSSHDNGSNSAGARPKTPFAGTPGGAVGRLAGATASRSADGGSAASFASLPDAGGSSSASFKRSSASSPGGPTTPGTAASRTSSPHSSSSAASPRTPSSPAYVHQLEGIVNACTFHPSGEFLLLAQDNGSLLILPFDAASSTDPLLNADKSSTSAGAAATAAAATAPEPLSLSLPLHQGGVTCCAADPAGRFVATGGSSSERCVLLLDAESMEVVGEIGRTEGGLQALSFSFDGQFLAWGCRDATAASSLAVGAPGRGSGGDGGSYRGSSNESSSEEKPETFLTIAGTDPCEIYLQCATPAAVSAVAFHPTRYICAFATEADTTYAAAQQQQSRQGVGGTSFWTKPQHSQQPYTLGFLCFE